MIHLDHEKLVLPRRTTLRIQTNPVQGTREGLAPPVMKKSRNEGRNNCLPTPQRHRSHERSRREVTPQHLQYVGRGSRAVILLIQTESRRESPRSDKPVIHRVTSVQNAKQGRPRLTVHLTMENQPDVRETTPATRAKLSASDE